MAILGTININDIEVLQLDADPSQGAGQVAPLGSLATYTDYTNSNALMFYKVGTGDLDWKRVDLSDNDWSLAGNALATDGSNFLGSTNDQDVKFKRNNVDIMRLINAGVVIGLNTALDGKLNLGAELGEVVTHLTSYDVNDNTKKVIRVSRQFRINTSDDTLSTLATITLSSGQRVQAQAFIVGQDNAGEGADYILVASAKKVGTAGAVLNRKANEFTAEDIRALKAKAEVNGDDLLFKVKGQASVAMEWTAHIDYSIFL